MCVCVCVCEWVCVLSYARAHVCVCVFVLGGGCRCLSTGVCLRACSLINPTCDAPPYCHLRRTWLQQIFRHYVINGTTFGKTLLNIKYVFWFYLRLLFEIFLILRKTQWDIITNEIKSSCKLPIILVGFSWNLNLSADFRKKKKKLKHRFIKIRPVGAEFFYSDAQTDSSHTEMTKLRVAFRNFANALKNGNERKVKKHSYIFKRFCTRIRPLAFNSASPFTQVIFHMPRN